MNILRMLRLRLSLCIIAVSFLGGMTPSKAQNMAIKTNLLYDISATVNAGIEIGLAPQWTLDVSGNLNAWNWNDHTKWKHWMIQPEARYWLCDRFSRHFVGAHLIGGAYNFGGIDNKLSFLGSDFSLLTENRYQGHAFGIGAAYGFAFVLSRYFNLELEAGLGYICTGYDKFECDGCGRKVAEGIHHYVGPTKLAVNLVYVF